MVVYCKVHLMLVYYNLEGSLLCKKLDRSIHYRNNQLAVELFLVIIAVVLIGK